MLLNSHLADLSVAFELPAAAKPSLDFDEAGAKITRSEYSWGTSLGQANTVSYAFRSNTPAYDNGDTGGYGQFNAQQIAVATLAFQGWSDVANISFTRVGSGTSGAAAYSNNATILLGDYTTGAAGAHAFTYLPGDGGLSGGDRSSTAADGDLFVNTTFSYDADPELWNRGFLILSHEIGHAIGMEHPGAYDGGAGSDPDVTYANSAEFYQDTTQYTVMSYFGETNTGADYHGLYASAPQLYDIAAAQRLYGANMSTRTGDTVYGFHSTAGRPWFEATTAASPVIFAVWDAGGRDTLDFSGYGQDQVIDLQQDHFSSVGGLTANIAIAQGVVIENAIGGGGGDLITGNDAANRLDGGAGADRLFGLAGADTLLAGAGDDRLNGGANLDTVQVDAGAGAVAIDLAAGTMTGEGADTLVSIENATGGNGADTLVGSGSANVLIGGVGADSLSGGGGADRLIGGRQDDVLTGAAGADRFVYTQTLDSTQTKPDLITDLAGADIIDLSAIDADTTRPGDQAFTLVDAFDARAGELLLQWAPRLGLTLLKADVNGDGKADLLVRIDGDVTGFTHFVL